MKGFDEFDFVRDLPRPRLRLSEAERAGLLRLGLKAGDVDALERAVALIPDDGDRRATAKARLAESMLHYRRHGEEILEGINICLEEILGREWPATVGSETLFGMARGGVKGFGIDNCLRALYVRILAARRPEAVRRLEFGTSGADLLVAAGWPPITFGEEADDEAENRPADIPPTPSALLATSAR